MVQALYASEIGGTPLSEAVREQVERRRPHLDSRLYAEELCALLQAHGPELDETIDRLLERRDPERVGAVERAVLRLAAAELKCRPDVPIAVVIDEAVELVRLFSLEDSARFVHGVLDRLGSILRSPGDAPRT